jgi:hypothetical protein
MLGVFPKGGLEMNGRENTTAKERYWQRVIDEAQGSGLSIRAFCARKRICEGSFYFWRRSLERGIPRVAGSGPEFIRVKVHESLLPVADSPIEIQVRGDRVVRVRSGCDRQLLADVLAVLEGKPC